MWRWSDGAARLGRGVGLSAGSYTADIHLDSAGQKREVAALRQMQVATLGQPPTVASPLAYRTPAIRGIVASSVTPSTWAVASERCPTVSRQNLRSGQGGTAAFFVDVLPGLTGEPEFVDALLDPDRRRARHSSARRSPSSASGGPSLSAWQSVFAFRDAGAAWGLVALDQGVESEPASRRAAGCRRPQAPLDTATTGGPRTTPSTVSPIVPEPGPTPVRPGPTPTTTTTTPPSRRQARIRMTGLLAPILDPLLAAGHRCPQLARRRPARRALGG